MCAILVCIMHAVRLDQKINNKTLSESLLKYTGLEKKTNHIIKSIFFINRPNCPPKLQWKIQN